MRAIFIILLSLCFSCSTKSTDHAEDKYVLMNDLWQNRATAEDVKKTFGHHFKDVESGIIYTFPNSKFPERGFFFDSSNKLRGQFAFMDQASLERLKKTIKCEWKEIEEKRSIAHYTRIFKKGSCSNPSISYETYPDLNAYEVRWKR
jgi:hypothetical protein